MAILSKTPVKDDGIPPMLDRRTNGKAQPSYEELVAQIAAMQAQLASKNTLKMKVSEKGALSIYGLQRFPITLYSEQWTRLLAAKDDILAFIEAHKAELSTK
jgi:hypothetical protein